MSVSSLQHEDISQKLQIHEFASKTQKNNFNIRRFTESKIKNKKQMLRTKYTQFSKNRMSTEGFQEHVKPFQSLLSENHAINRIMSKKQPDYNKRMALTGSLKHHKKRSMTLNKQYIPAPSQNQINPDILAESERARKYRQMSKKHNKGPLSHKVIQTWMNSILTQSTQLQIIDQSIANAALKKFQIDQNSMLSRGIKHQNVQRIYQTLFVHSIGFNNCIKQLVCNNNQVMKNVWRVFSILLEYCAEGKFQTLIGVIQRDKAIKVEQLREEIAKRQQIIQKNDQLNQTKNIQIFKQIRQLKQQNINLTNQKDVLFQDFQKTQQAFNQQVSLRLKFENKINQLFGVHRQLAIKHQHLYDDYKKKLVQWNIANQKYSQISRQNGELKISINDLTTDKQRLIITQKYNKQVLNVIKSQQLKLNQQCNLVRHQYDQQRRINKQHKRRITQLQIQIKNLVEIVAIKDKSWLQTHQQYQLSLQQNRRLYNILTQQRNQIQQLLYQKKQFNNKTINILADASFQKKKKQQFTKLYYDLDKINKQLEQNIKLKQLQHQILSKKYHSLQSDISCNYQNIQKMHNKNDQLQDQLQYLRSYKQQMDKILKQKTLQNEQLFSKNQYLEQQNQKYKSSLSKIQLNYKILKGQFDNDTQSNKLKYNQMKQQRQALQIDDITKIQELYFTKIQLEKINKALQSTTFQLKNQRFQRVHLKANYQQSLNIIQKKNQQQKQMGREISQLKDTVLKFTQQRTNLLLKLSNQTSKKQSIQQVFTEIKTQYQLYKQRKSSAIHPLIFQDLAGKQRRLTQKFSKTQLSLKRTREQLKQLQQKSKSQLALLTKSHTQYISSLKKQKQKQFQQKQSQLQYQKQLTLKMRQKLKYLQQLADTYSKKISQKTCEQKQLIYLDLIQQKTKIIQQLINKLNQQCQSNQSIKLELIKIKQINQENLINVKQKFKMEMEFRDSKINDLYQYKNHYQSQIAKLKLQIINYQTQFQQKLKQSINNYLQNYRNLDNNAIITPPNHDLPEQQQIIPSPKMTWTMNQSNQKDLFKDRMDIARKLQIAYAHYK